jgi:hypothetical protein
MRSKILPFYWLVGVVAAALLGFLPNPAARGDPALHVYATQIVLGVLVLMTLQALLLVAILRPATYARSWGRALLALIVSFGFEIMAVAGAMHSPPAWGALLLWTLALLLGTLTLMWVSALGASAEPREDRARLRVLLATLGRGASL